MCGSSWSISQALWVGTDLLRRARFVWAAVRGFDLANHTPLPLAVAPKPCMHRQIGTDALDQAGIDWRMAFTSPSQRGLRAAVQAGLAITALPQENLEPDWLPSMAGMDCRLCLMQVSG